MKSHDATHNTGWPSPGSMEFLEAMGQRQVHAMVDRVRAIVADSGLKYERAGCIAVLWADGFGIDACGTSLIFE
jgi:hypothetical protein